MLFDGVGTKLREWTDWLGAQLVLRWWGSEEVNRVHGSKILQEAGLPAAEADELMRIATSGSPAVFALIVPFLIWQVLAPMGQALSAGDTEDLTRKSLARVRPTPASGPEAAAGLQRRFIDMEQFQEIIARNGLNDRDAGLLLSLSRQYLSAVEAAQLRRRGIIDESEFLERAQHAGMDHVPAELTYQLTRSLLPEEALVTAQMREHITTEAFLEYMGMKGVTPEDAETLRLVLQWYPTPSVIIEWMSHEVFEPDQQEKYGLRDEFDKLDLTVFARAGIDAVQALNLWVSHWVHPSFEQVGDMYHRDVLDDPLHGRELVPGSPEWEESRARAMETFQDWFRLVEVPPYWRQRMIEKLFQPLTRVDVRRAWDLGVATDDDVIRTYLDEHYSLKNARILLMYTKVERSYPSLIARYKNGYIKKEGVIAELIDIGLEPDKALELWQRKIESEVKEDRIQANRELTKAEIIRGTKLKVLTLAEAASLLERMGYDPDEAAFILAINVPPEE